MELMEVLVCDLQGNSISRSQALHREIRARQKVEDSKHGSISAVNPICSG